MKKLYKSKLKYYFALNDQIHLECYEESGYGLNLEIC